jgi:hypothetical protein
MQFYDPGKIIDAVQELLRSNGLTPQVADGVLVQNGACMLLRGLGVFPAVDAIDAYARMEGSGSWPDADDRRAAKFA